MISLIIPTLNEEQDIEELLESIKSQTYKYKEIIVVDGGSTDRTVEIAKRYAKVFVLKKAGVTASRNYGASKSKGNLLQFLDADAVMIDKDYLKNLVNAYRKYNVDIVVNRTDAYPPRNMLGDAQLTYRKTTWEANQKGIVINAYPPNIAFSSYTRKAFNKLGGYNEKMIGNDDINLSERAREAGLKTVFIPDIVLYHKDPYTFSQIKRQMKWYARVLVRHDSVKKQIFTFSYFGSYLLMYLLAIFSAVFHNYNLSLVFILILLFPAIYLLIRTGDLLSSLYLSYIVNPFKAICLCSEYIKELLR